MTTTVKSPPPPGVTRVNEDRGTFSERFPVLFEDAGRVGKAAKIVAVLRHHFGPAISGRHLLDIGCSTGIMTIEYAGAVGSVTALDMDHVGVRHGRARAERDGAGERIAYLVGDACGMPLGDCSVDAVVLNQVYEHVDDQEGLLAETLRVLRPGGVCYFGIGTRHVLIEGHYKLPFLSWLPHRWADRYMRLAGKQGRYDVTLLSYRNLRKLARRFAVRDYTPAIIKCPVLFAEPPHRGLRGLVARLPRSLLGSMRPIIPVHVWLLVKPDPMNLGETGEAGDFAMVPTDQEGKGSDG